MFGKRLPDAITCWSEKHEALHKALEAKKSAKISEALETRGQGLRAGTTAALKMRKLLNGPFAGLTARKRRLKAMLEAPPKRSRDGHDRSKVFIVPGKRAEAVQLLPGQSEVGSVDAADLVVVPSLGSPSRYAAEAMLLGRTICASPDIGRSKHVTCKARAETQTAQSPALQAD